MKYRIETLTGEWVCTHWEKVWCPCFGCNDLDDKNLVEEFIVFQSEKGNWHFFKISMINIIESV